MTGAGKRIALEAAAWVVKFDGVEFDARDVTRFRRWLQKSDAHRAAFEAASRTWDKLDLLSKLEAFPLPAHPEPAPRLGRRELIGLSSAGAAALAIGGYAALSGGRAEAHETAIGELREFSLQDGTHVWLNADSRLETRSDARAARLVRGEALFAIAPSASVPFSISAPGGGVDALGGEVLVKILPAGVRVSLLSDPGRVRRRGFLSDDARTIAEARSEIELGGGGVAVAPADSALLSRRLSWREGRLAFDNTTLAEAAADVARHSGRRFTFADPRLAELRVGGLINAGDVDGFVMLLHQNLGVSARNGADGLIVLSQS